MYLVIYIDCCKFLANNLSDHLTRIYLNSRAISTFHSQWSLKLSIAAPWKFDNIGEAGKWSYWYKVSTADCQFYFNWQQFQRNLNFESFNSTCISRPHPDVTFFFLFYTCYPWPYQLEQEWNQDLLMTWRILLLKLDRMPPLHAQSVKFMWVS